MSAIIEKQRHNYKNIYILYADTEKCFDKLWLKVSLSEMERIRYNKNDTKMLYEINKTIEIVVNTAIKNTESIEITEVVKQGLIFGLTMRFATTAKVNDVGEKIWGDRKRNFSIYVGMRKCAKMEVQKKMKYSLDKTKYMVIRTGKEMEEDVSEQVKAGNIKKYKRSIYLGITVNEEENLKGDIEELKQKCEAISREAETIGSKNQVGKEEIKVQLKLFEPCFMPALIYGVWGCIKGKNKGSSENTKKGFKKNI